MALLRTVSAWDRTAGAANVLCHFCNGRKVEDEVAGLANNLHWVLDVSFGEDDNRTRCDHGAENLSILRRVALTLLNRHKGSMTIPNMKFRAALDPVFRTKLS